MISAAPFDEEPHAAATIPTLTWFPVRYINPVIAGEVPLERVLAQAPEFGFTHVELHYRFLPDRLAIQRLRSLLSENGLGLSMLTCAPDFTHPDVSERERQLDAMRRQVDMGHALGARAVRVTAGMAHEGVSRDEGLSWAAEGLTRTAEYSQQAGVVPCLENHYKDRTWPLTDFAAEMDVFLDLVERLATTSVMVNFDTAQPMVMQIDEVALLERVVQRVRNVHAGDRKHRQRAHSVIGDGDVRFSRVFAILRSAGYAGFITVEDGSAYGDDGLHRGLAFLRRQIAEQWGATCA